MSVAEMKPSQVLREALAKFEGGEKWTTGEYFAGEKCCSLGALRRVTGYAVNPLVEYKPYGDCRDYLYRATGRTITDWNDTAADFSVIEQGFNKAIALAESEGK